MKLLPYNSIYLPNKYTECYYNLVNNALNRGKISGYTEKHHIIPRCMGGSDDKDNLVVFTAREHFIAHWLLTKMVDAIKQKSQMENALSKFLQAKGINGEVRRVLSSGEYHRAREAASFARYGQRLWTDGKIVIWAHECPGENWKPTSSTGGMKCYNNGIENKLFETNPGPDWTLGMMRDRTGYVWWNDGIRSTMASEQPGPDWSRGTLVNPTEGKKLWHNKDTNEQVYTDDIDGPGPNWVKGSAPTSISTSGLSWWNNGKQNKISSESPGPGWGKRSITRNKRQTKRSLYLE